ncbi:MAG: hypothetical protein Q8L47_03160 [bacterium]|nr:hypothetical protein [bacterium]
MSNTNIEISKKETYLKLIENSIGTRLFNSLIVKYKNTGEVIDILHNGELSCAYFVSSIIVLMSGMETPHTTVKTVRNKLIENNWKVVTGGIEPGDVLFWEKVKFDDGNENEHIGFALNSKEAISTSWIEHKVVRHPIISTNHEGNKISRKITAVYRKRDI